MIIWQIDPATARGRPETVADVWGTEMIIPESGGPAAPGVRRTAHPMVTGKPGILNLLHGEKVI